MKGYSEMSDHEINVMVAAKLGVDAKCDDGYLFTSKKHVGENVISVTTVTDYCNNPSDMLPLIVENGICITSPIRPREKWTASWFVEGGNWPINDATFSDKNPLRSAAIVFLMLNEG